MPQFEIDRTLGHFSMPVDGYQKNLNLIENFVILRNA